eukprot:1158425-Pelagomonas_calceolata.AAC.7
MMLLLLAIHLCTAIRRAFVSLGSCALQLRVMWVEAKASLLQEEHSVGSGSKASKGEGPRSSSSNFLGGLFSSLSKRSASNSLGREMSGKMVTLRCVFSKRAQPCLT